MIDFLVSHWPYVLLVVCALVLAGSIIDAAGEAGRDAADSLLGQADREHVIQAGGGFRLVDARAAARVRLAEGAARANTRPHGGCDNVVPLRRPREVRRADDAS